MRGRREATPVLSIVDKAKPIRQHRSTLNGKNVGHRHKRLARSSVLPLICALIAAIRLAQRSFLSAERAMVRGLWSAMTLAVQFRSANAKRPHIYAGARLYVCGPAGGA